MPRYDALIQRIRNHEDRVKCNDEFVNTIYRLAHEHIIEIIEDEFLATDGEEVKHGEWECDKVAFYRICPECGCGIRLRDEVIFLNPVDHKANYCPNCGTKMDGKKNKDGDISET